MLMNQIMLAINRHQSNIGYAKLGIISSCNPADSSIKVVIQPEDVEIGPMPYCTPWIGWYAPPSPGDQCLVIYQEGNKGTPIGALLLYWNGDQPPVGVGTGEALWLHTETSSSLKLTNSGKVLINGSIEIDLTAPKIVITTTGDTVINAGGNANITATTSASVTAPNITLGNGTSMTDALVQLSKLQAAYDSHTHSGVQTGSGNTGAPTSPLGAVGTSVVTGA